MRQKRKQISQEIHDTRIESLSHELRGVARIDGKATFIDGVLPGETVQFRYTRQKAQFDEGRLEEVVDPSPERVEPRCPHTQMCGGCSIQHMSPAFQIEAKQRVLAELFQKIAKTAPNRWLAPLQASVWHYRSRARLSVRFVEKKGDVLIGFREKHNPRYITQIQSCAILDVRVSDMLPSLKTLCMGLSDKSTIAQIEVAASGSDLGLVFRHLHPLTDKDITLLSDFAKAQNVVLYLQPAGPDSIHKLYPENDEPLDYVIHGVRYQYYPDDFTQIHSELNTLMVAQALDLLDLKKNEKVMDLFCGLGNFSLPMASRVASLVGIEGSTKMVERAKANASLNAIENAVFYARNLEDCADLLELSGGAIDKLLIDPPRTGAQAVAQTIDRLKPKRLVYVSCNPATLARDAEILVQQKGYTLEALGVMDMFPHTTHVESMALFTKE